MQQLLTLLYGICLCLLVALLLDPREERIAVEQDLPRFECVAYSPFHHLFAFDPSDFERTVDLQQVRRDFAVLQSVTSCLRIYSIDHGMSAIPEIALDYGFSLIVGTEVFLDPDHRKQRLELLVRLANEHANITHVIVGNETLYEAEFIENRSRRIPPEDLADALQFVRARVSKPVSTAEPHHIWIQNSWLSHHVDFVGYHIFPFWEEAEISDIERFIDIRHRHMERAFPGKGMHVLETGWPFRGPANDMHEPGKAKALEYFRKVKRYFELREIPYVVLEAFDQPWKKHLPEGPWGAHWGLYDSEGVSKTSSVEHRLFGLRFDFWQTLFLFLALPVFLLSVNIKIEARQTGLVLFATITVFLLASGALMAREFALNYYHTDLGTWLFVIPVGVFALLLSALRVFESCEALFHKPRKRTLRNRRRADQSYQPFISIHVPCRNEEPAHVLACLQSLSALDYPSYEVVVVDNNTDEDAKWRPLEEFCKEQGEQFLFFHVDGLQGFKAGALNYALKKTSAQAEVIAVVDSDYIVDPDWLKVTSSYLAPEEVASVQSPQDYQWDDSCSWFSQAAYCEYKSFFKMGMVSRNDDNSILQHGTMVLIKRPVLEKLEGWAESSIVEDAELGIRILKEGLESIYLNRSFGKGILPPSYAGYARQRIRWAYGAITLCLAHKFFLFPIKGMSFRQRLRFLLGWFPWLLHLSVPLIVFAAVVIGAEFVRSFILVYPTVFLLPLFIFVGVEMVFGGLSYYLKVERRMSSAFLSQLAGLSLTWPIAFAVWTGLLNRNYPFKITPKSKLRLSERHALVQGFFGVALLLIAILVLLEMPLESYQRMLPWIIAFLLIALPAGATWMMLHFESVRGGERSAS